MFEDFDYTPYQRLETARNYYSLLNATYLGTDALDRALKSDEFQNLTDCADRHVRNVILNTGNIKDFEEYMRAFVAYFDLVEKEVDIEQRKQSFDSEKYKANEINS